MIIFRVDGSRKIGFGHIRRCLNLAGALSGEVLFLTMEKEAEKYISSAGYEVILISNNREIGKYADERSVLITDMFGIDYDFLADIRAKKFCIDGSTELQVPDCDILVNANVFEDGPDGTFLGPDYMILAEEYASPFVPNIRQDAKSIFMGFGGVDAGDYTNKALEELSDLPPDIEIDVVLGPLYEGNAMPGNNVRIHSDPPDLIEIMKRSDIAITASGILLYELAALGIPTITIPQVPHQEEIARAFHGAGACINLGPNIEKGKLFEETMMLLKDWEHRTRLSRNSRKFVDGRGLARSVDLIKDLIEKVEK